MHTTHSNTQYKNQSKHSEMGPVRQNPIQRTVSLFICVCIALCTIVAHNIARNRTDLIVFPLTLQTITTAPMMSIWGKGGGLDCSMQNNGVNPVFFSYTTNPYLRLQRGTKLPSCSANALKMKCIVFAANWEAASVLNIIKTLVY